MNVSTEMSIDVSMGMCPDVCIYSHVSIDVSPGISMELSIDISVMYH